MLKKSKKDVKNQKGFTMIEIIIGIAIAGIISAATVPSFLNMTTKTQLKADIQSVQTLQSMIDMYTADHDGKLPTGLTKDTREIPQTVYTKLKESGYLSEEDLNEAGTSLNLQTPDTVIKYNGKHVVLEVSSGADDRLKTMIKDLSSRENKWMNNSEENGE